MGDQFQTTRWSLVLAAGQGTHGSHEALEWLCATYWYPLYAFVRRQGLDVESAHDMTQSFFLMLLDGPSLQRLDPRHGRFRAFLLASMKHFLSNQRARERAIKRRTSDRAFVLSLDEAEERYGREHAGGLTPEEHYETRWALEVLARAIQRLGSEQDTTGRGEQWRRLQGHLTGDEIPYATLAAELGTTDGALRVAVHRLRRRLGELLREEVAQTVAASSDVDEEIRHLLSVIGRGAA